MDPDGNPYLYLIIPLIFMFIAAVINAGYTSVVTLSDSKIKKLADDGDEKAKKILRLTDDPVKFLFRIEVATTLCTIGTAGFAAVWIGHFVNTLPFDFGGIVVGVIAVGLAVAWIVLFIVLSILIPRRVASQFSEKISYALISPLSLLCCISAPVAYLSKSVAYLILEIFRIDLNHDVEKVTEEEIMMMVDAGNEKGVINESEKQMIFNVFDFDDKTVGEVMTHRTDIVGVEVTDPMSEVISLAIKEGYSRIPVFEDDLDNIVGIIYVKDLLPLIGRTDIDSIRIDEYMRPTIYVPESVHCREMFASMRDKKVQLAIVVDEYGGTSGIVTMEDLIESIVGNIQDEYDNEEEEFVRVDDDTFVIDGSAPLDDVSRVLGIEVPDETEYDTIGGLIMDLLGRIPAKGENPAVEYEGWKLTVMGVEERRIVKVRAVREKKSAGDHAQQS